MPREKRFDQEIHVSLTEAQLAAAYTLGRRRKGSDQDGIRAALDAAIAADPTLLDVLRPKRPTLEMVRPVGVEPTRATGDSPRVAALPLSYGRT